MAGWLALFLMLCLPVLAMLLTSPGRVHSTGANKSGSPAPTKAASDKPARQKDVAGTLEEDMDHDGIPDGAELRSFQDRDNFRRWFGAIAEMQFYRVSAQWNPEQRDCAGLVRFAWREALRPHNRPWFQKMGPDYEPVAPDVAESRPDHPALGDKLFRTDFGSFTQSDLAAGKFSEFADARTLKSFNTKFVGRDRSQALPGDLIFFYQASARKFPYHVMIFLGPARIDANGERDWVVYHTGSSPDDSGTVKKVGLAVLDQHPDPRWRPVEGNRNFLGFFRLKILE